MQKISPLRASLDAFNRFKAARVQNKNNNESKSHTNPFGITFKGTMLQMDVFETKTHSQNPLKEKMANTGKMLASAWVGTINRFNSIKQNVISFGKSLKNNTMQFVDKMNNTKIDLDIFKYSVSSLQKRPVGELESMLRSELGGLANA